MTQTPNTAVTLERLAQLLDAYGGEPARWPEAERGAALQLIAARPEAKALLTAALELDGALDLHALPDEAEPQLRARILEIPIRHPRPEREDARGWGLGQRRNWLFALFALTPCVIGFLSSTLLTEPVATSEDDSWDELAQVVMPGQISDELNMFDEESP